ncbi:glycoside hydrolase family 47 protein [Suillus spraguei]|nr:glycoside hydrolase family 47 protein [Suillus spraguei]
MSFRRWFLAALATSVVKAEPVQKQGLQLPPSAALHQSEVKELFVTSYEAYQTYAWGMTICAHFKNWIMGLTDWFEQAVNHTANTDFSVSHTSDTVSLFETTIRYVGGFLSAYELSGEKYPILVEKAQDLADQMAYAWVGNQVIPFGYIDFATQQPTIATSNIAEAGTLTMEWNRLSQYTGNSTYKTLVEESVQHMIHMTWGGGSDSYFEYLIKYARLTNTDDNSYADAWLTAVDSSIKTLLKTSTVDDLLYLADYDDDKKIRHVGSHLACFYGGNWILGGKLTNNATVVDIGLKLTDACWNTYASTAYYWIGPEIFAYISSDGNYTGDTAPNQQQLDFYDQHGFYITYPDYILRPEVLESNFYAWRVTGDPKYFNNAVSAVTSFKKYLPANVAYAGIYDVNNVDSDKVDDMESFWFAEVLKYLYLTFDDPSHISLDEYVFNTECHPFKAPPAKSNYGSDSPHIVHPSHSPRERTPASCSPTSKLLLSLL